MQKLIEELGAAKVSTAPEAIRTFSEDLTEIPGHAPDAVVFAEGVEDVRRVLAYAAREKVPVIPVVNNTNVGGLAIPEKGGIVLEMRRMDRVLEVNERDMYLVIEPGVTWKQVRELLDAKYPSLRFGYSLSPPESSVMANCLMDGLTNLSLRHGPTTEWVNGVEAVLSTGEVVRTGIGALGPHWCTNSPMPDLTGLFLNMHGTTGVVTKLAVQAWPNRKFRRRLFVSCHDPRLGLEFASRLAREELMDDIGGISWSIARQLFGVNRPAARAGGEPALWLLLDFSSNFEEEFRVKEMLARRLVRDALVGEEILDLGELVRLLPEFGPFADLPARFTFLLDHGGGGLTWIGSYGPCSRWAEGWGAGTEVMERFGFPPSVVVRPMRGAHFGVLRFVTTFDKSKPEEVARVREMNGAICEAIVPLGFVPYKTPAWVVKRFADRIDPGFQAVLRRVKEAMDPHHILNPGKWLLE